MQKRSFSYIKAFSYVGTIALSASLMALQPTSEMGKGLYHQEGANSCLHCHGIDGKGGKVAAAAALHEPKKWKAYKALGGDAAFAKDKEDFLKKMKEATTHVIQRGAIVHNSQFKRDWFDWEKTGGPYDAQMLGITGAPSRSWVNRFKERGVTPEIASEALWLYMKEFDTQGVLK